MLRILLLAPHPFFQERGTPIAERLALRALVRRGYRVDVLAYHEGEPVSLPGVRLFRIPSPGLHGIRPGFSWKKVACDLLMWRAARRLVETNRYHLIHAVEEAVFLAMRLGRRRGLPYVYDMDSSLSRQLLEGHPEFKPAARLLARAERAAIRRSLGVLVMCRELEEEVHRLAPEKLVGRVEDISLLDLEPPDPALPVPELGLEGPLVMYVGNLEPYQGVGLLLNGFALAAPRHPAAKLVVIGGDPARVAAYQRRAAELGLAGRAFFPGPRPSRQLGQYLRQAAVVVSPRITGGNTPMKIYSYLDSGRPLLATRLATHTQVLDDSLALLVDPTPAALAEGLDRLLADPALGERLAAAARRKVAEEYCFAAFVRKLDAFYDQVERRFPRAEGATA